jgi:hypothetical protein
MKWTQNKPTKPGYYWYKEIGWKDKIIVSVYGYDNDDLEMFYFGKLDSDYLREINPNVALWAGPIENNKL